MGDRLGRKWVIWASILGVLPFTLALPYVNLFWTGVLSVAIGVILASAFSAILVFAQELVPGRIGMVSGLFFGFAFGTAGIGAALLGDLADRTGIEFVYRLCSYLPALGLLTAFLPNIESGGRRRAAGARAVDAETVPLVRSRLAPPSTLKPRPGYISPVRPPPHRWPPCACARRSITSNARVFREQP